MSSVFIDKTANLSGLIDRARRMNSPLATLLPPIAAGRLTLALATSRGQGMSMARLHAIPGPVLVLLGDDDYSATGPTKWTSAANLIRWASAVMIHAAGAEPAHYREAARGAMITGRLLLIETSSAHANEWAAAAGPKVRLVIVPKNGPHPVTPSLEAMH